MAKNNVFETLNAINCNEHVEKKQNLTYLSWAWAWAEVKKAYPEAYYTIYENKDGWNYHTDGKTCWVKTGVTIEGIEHIEYLPVMDYKNKSIGLEYVTSFDVNKSIQRSLTKACARHGLGLYIYAGEDLPEKPAEQSAEQSAEQPKQTKLEKAAEAVKEQGFEQAPEANMDLVETFLKQIDACKTRAEVLKFTKLKNTPEFPHIRVAANNKYQSLKS